MYCEFYGMAERPFNVTPDPKFLYLNSRYREAIASLHYGITQRKGFITLIGEAGTGKTTLLKRLLEDLDPKTKSVFIFNTNVTFEEILEYIFAEFDLAVHNGKKLYMLQRLNTFLLEELRNGGNVALLIDEAQDLEYSVLEDLRLLSNLETAKEKILQIILSGQPELGQKLSNPILRQLRQRISINCRLLPLSRDEITEYLQFRLQAAGCPDLKLFSREAEERVYHFSRGVPRLVNVVCDNALVIGYALGKKRIGADIIDEAAADLLPVELEPENAPERSTTTSMGSAIPAASTPDRWRQRFMVGGLVVMAVIVGLMSLGRFGGDSGRAGDSAQSPAQFEVIQPGSSGVEVKPGAAVAAVEQRDLGDLAMLPDEADIRDPRVEVQRWTGASGAAAVSAGSDSAGRETLPQPPPQPVAAGDPLAVPEVPEVEPEAAAEIAAPPEPARQMAKLEIPEAPAPPPAAVVPAEPEVVPVAKIVPESEPVAVEKPVAKAEVQATSGGAPRLDGVPFADVTVRSGDSISQIAIQKYGQASPVILDLLKLSNPELSDIDVIVVGQKIRLPQLSDGFPILNHGSGRYSLLVFSTRESWRAQGLRTALRSKGFDATISNGSLGRGKPMMRVVVQGFGNREEVVAAGQKLQRLFREDGSIAQLSK